MQLNPITTVVIEHSWKQLIMVLSVHISYFLYYVGGGYDHLTSYTALSYNLTAFYKFSCLSCFFFHFEVMLSCLVSIHQIQCCNHSYNALCPLIYSTSQCCSASFSHFLLSRCSSSSSSVIMILLHYELFKISLFFLDLCCLKCW